MKAGVHRAGWGWARAGLLAAATAFAVAVVPVPVAAQDTQLSPRELVPLLTRTGVAPDLTLLDVIYAPPLFFESTGIAAPAEMAEQPTLAFLFQETVHEGELPVSVPAAYVLLPDGERIAPYQARVTTEDEHHRVSRLLFPAPDDWLASMRLDDGRSVLRLVVPHADGTFSAGNTFEWTVPIEAPDGDPAEVTAG